MRFKNLQELLEAKEKLINEKHLYDKAVYNAQIEQKNTRRSNREYWNDVIENYNKIISDISKKIEALDNILYQAISLPKEICMTFLLECININEDEKYVSRNLVLSLSPHLTTNEMLPTYGNFEIIFPESLLKQETKLENTFYISVMQHAYKELFEKSDVKYIMMPTEGYINLLSDNLSLLTYYKSFPYLESIGINLIERRLREPEKKIIDIFNDELEELKENKKIKNLCE